MTRAFFVWLHRWAGLGMAAFLIIVGLTGSLLAFWLELNHWLTPELYPTPRAGVALDGAALARSAEAILPHGRINTVYMGYPGFASVGVEARDGAPPLGFDSLHLDPIDGHELGRVSWSGLPAQTADIMPFVYRLHMFLAMSGIGEWILGIVAIVWTIDCFVGFYLTLPPPGDRARKSFLARWKPSWLVRSNSSFYRLNFDVHRASGLWLWAILLVYAWTGVYFTMPGVYARVMQAASEFEQPVWSQHGEGHDDPRPPLPWEKALETGRALMDEQAGLNGFAVYQPLAFYRLHGQGLYEYRVRSSRDIGDRAGATSVFFDMHTGELKQLSLPTGLRSGNTFTTWLVELHMANLFGLPYRIFVCVVGIVIAILSLTGVYIWWKKRAARIIHSKAAATATVAVTKVAPSSVSKPISG